MDASLTIGKLAESAGVNIETLRYYQRRGLLDAPPKPYTGYRRYDQRHVTRIRFIKRAQTLGFTLSEVAELITLDGGTGTGTGACAETRDIASRKLALIERRIADLVAMQGALRRLVRQCDAGGPDTFCPIIDALAAT